MVSSLKNTMARKNHKERGQLDSRKRLGLLEKHKDYVHRARDYSSKQARIKKLREKAAFRNKDEFYWGMVKGKTQNGVAVGDRGNVALSSETVKLLKTQDVRYVRHQISKDQRKCATIKRELESTLPPSAPGQWDARLEVAEVERLADLGIQVEPQGSSLDEYKQRAKKGSKLAKGEKHLVFAEDRSEFETMGAGPSKVAEKREKVATEDLGWDDAPAAAPEDSEVEEEVKAGSKLSETDMKDAQNHRLTLYADLSALLVRLRELRVVEAKLGANLGHLGKGAAQKVQKAGWVEDEEAEEDRNGEKKTFRKDVWKWKLERRR